MVFLSHLFSVLRRRSTPSPARRSPVALCQPQSPSRTASVTEKRGGGRRAWCQERPPWAGRGESDAGEPVPRQQPEPCDVHGPSPQHARQSRVETGRQSHQPHLAADRSGTPAHPCQDVYCRVLSCIVVYCRVLSCFCWCDCSVFLSSLHPVVIRCTLVSVLFCC